MDESSQETSELSSVAEVELVTLVQDHQTPLYRLRADSLTLFSGYENQDWYISTPVIDSNEPLELTSEFISETLKYFILSSERLSQMTKTYNDIDAVTRLLEEKERDLELAARIGQSLLDQNKSLKSRNEELESELTRANDNNEKLNLELLSAADRVTQLKHDLNVKNGLLQIYSADLEMSESSHMSSDESPDPRSNSSNSFKDRKSSLILNWETIHEKVCCLEDENQKLRQEASTRVSDLEEEERKELQLIHDCAKQLTDANVQLFSLQDEVSKRADDNIRQQEEITNLLTQVVDLQRKNRDLNIENEGIKSALYISHECQNELSAELLDIKDKFEILLGAFHELQEELKKKSRLAALNHVWPPSYMGSGWESLAAEIESTLESEGYESEFSSLNNNNNHHHHNHNNNDAKRSEVRRDGCDTPDSMTGDSLFSMGSFCCGPSDNNKCLVGDDSKGDLQHNQQHMDDSLSSSGAVVTSSTPSSQNVKNHHSAFGNCTLHSSCSSSRGVGSSSSCTTCTSSTQHQPNHNAFNATGGGGLNAGCSNRSLFVRDRLKIVKSLEGSETLNKWKKLATPHLGVILEQHSGVQSKALKDLNQELLQYVISSRENLLRRSQEKDQMRSPQDYSQQNEERAATHHRDSNQHQKIMRNRDDITSSSQDDSDPEMKSSDETAFEKRMRSLLDMNKDDHGFYSSDDNDIMNTGSKYEPHPGKLFDSTSSTFTFTTTSLSLTSDSTVVTPSFSSFQLSTGHNSPITSTSSTTSSHHPLASSTCISSSGSSSYPTYSLNPFSSRIFGSSRKHNDEPESTPSTTSSQGLVTCSASFSSSSTCGSNHNNSGKSLENSDDVLSGDKDDANENEPKTSGHDPHPQNPSRDDQKMCDDRMKSDVMSEKSEENMNIVNGTSGLGQLASSDLLNDSSTRILTKGYNLSFTTIGLEDLVQKQQRQASRRIGRMDHSYLRSSCHSVPKEKRLCFVGPIPACKTLRKGGYV